jgi:hypothetical protein
MFRFRLHCSVRKCNSYNKKTADYVCSYPKHLRVPLRWCPFIKRPGSSISVDCLRAVTHNSQQLGRTCAVCQRTWIYVADSICVIMNGRPLKLSHSGDRKHKCTITQSYISEMYLVFNLWDVRFSQKYEIMVFWDVTACSLVYMYQIPMFENIYQVIRRHNPQDPNL